MTRNYMAKFCALIPVAYAAYKVSKPNRELSKTETVTARSMFRRFFGYRRMRRKKVWDISLGADIMLIDS